MRLALLVITTLISTAFVLGQDNLDAKVVKLGVITSLSGAVANWGQNTREGMEMAAQAVNDQGGIRGKSLEIIFEDFAEMNQQRAASAVQKLLQVDKVNVLLTQWSEDTEVAWPIASRQNILTVTYAAGARNITKGKKLLFRTWIADDIYVREVVKYAASLSKERGCIIAQQSAYFESMLEVAKEQWQVLTGAEPLVAEHTGDISDFRPYLLRFKNCSSLLILSTQGLLPSLLKQIKLLKLSALLIGYPGVGERSVIDVAGDYTNGIVFASYPAASEEFIIQFTKRYGRAPGSPAASAYDAVKIIAQAMNKFGLTTADIVSGLQQIKDFAGASGPLSFTADGDRAPLPIAPRLWKIEHGEIKPLKQN